MSEGMPPSDGPTGTGWRPAEAPRPEPAHPDPVPEPASRPPAQAPPPQAREPEMKRSGTATFEGEARSMQQRTESLGESGSRSIWTFRLERYDAHGNRLRPVQVEMRGLAFEGSLSDGDSVRVTGRWRDGTIRAKAVENLTTGALVKSKSYKGAMIAALIVFLIIAGLFAWFAINASNEFNDQFQGNQQDFQEQVDQSNQEFQQQEEEARQQFCEEAANAGLTPANC
jgi:hypothetical protein